MYPLNADKYNNCNNGIILSAIQYKSHNAHKTDHTKKCLVYCTSCTTERSSERLSERCSSSYVVFVYTLKIPCDKGRAIQIIETDG